MELQIEPEALAVLARVEQFLKERQVEAYLVGGFVRDTLAGRNTEDIDIAISGDVLEIAPEMAEELGGSFVLLDEANKITRVVLTEPTGLTEKKQWYIDLSTLAGDIFQDLARRDFTINAMAIELGSLFKSPETLVVIDPFKGYSDLRRKSIKAAGKTVFEDDPARLLRAVRLAARLGFKINSRTESLIKRSAYLVSRVAGERVKEEWLRILGVPGAGRILRYMDRLGLLTALIPELEASRGIEQPREHHWDVFNHALETVRAVDYLLRQDTLEYAPEYVLREVPWSEKLEQHFASGVGSNSTRAALLRMAALLHDIAKPETKIIAKERVRFFGHSEQGAEAAVEILERLKFSNKEIKLVELMVRYHLRPTQMSQQGFPSPRAIYRYFRDTGAAGIDILFLSLADHLAARGPELTEEDWQWHTGQVNYILTECNRRQEIITPPKLIDGHDLMNLFGLKPGPRLREILEAVKEAQAAGEIADREQALSYVKNRLL